MNEDRIYEDYKLKEFIEKSGKYLALVNDPEDTKTRYFTMFIANNKDNTFDEILNIVNELGECISHFSIPDDLRYVFEIKGVGWYVLVDYSNGVIECE